MRPESLHEAIRGGGYEASIITTYSIYFPFFEEIVLPRLRASGCRHNVILADARQCTRAIADGTAAPRRAGSEYTLLPIQAAAAFHPKILLMVGRKKATLYVGSHNLTLAGFGYNRELTSFLSFDPNRSPSEASTARTVWRSIKEWVDSAGRYLPTQTKEAVVAIGRHAPWLDEEDKKEASPVVLVQRSGGSALLDQLYPYAPKNVRRIAVLGAFFDAKVEFLSLLKSRWPKAEVIVAIDPSTVSLPGSMLAKAGVAVRDASAIGTRDGYLHAKAIYFEGRGGDDLFACGSANPSAPAWTGGSRGNDEAILLSRGISATQAAKVCGLSGAAQLPEIEPEQVRALVRNATPDDVQEDFRATILVCETSEGFEVPKALVGNAKSCVAFDLSANVKDLTALLRETGDKIIVSTDAESRDRTVRLRFTLRGGIVVDAVVHHVDKIKDLTRSSQQVQLRVALQGLTSESTDLHRILVAMEKTIFSDDEAIEAEISSAASRRQAESEQENESSPKPKTLAIAARDTRKARGKHSRLLQSSNLGYVLDVLIHRLGIGLETIDSNLDVHRRSEEESIGQDDDDSSVEGNTQEVDDVQLASLCRAKTRKLVGRMIKQLERERGKATEIAVWLVQLLAVLAVLRELRRIGKATRWLKTKDGLVDRESEVQLLRAVLRAFFGRNFDLYRLAVSSLGDELFDELARLKGLLTWLAWDCDVVLDPRFGISEDREDIAERLWKRAALLELTQILCGDDVARVEARESILSVAVSAKHQAASAWLADLERWSAEVESAVHSMSAGKLGKQPSQIGELAFVTGSKQRRLHIVKSLSSGSVELFDFGPDSNEVAYKRSYVATPALTR